MGSEKIANNGDHNKDIYLICFVYKLFTNQVCLTIQIAHKLIQYTVSTLYIIHKYVYG